MKARIKPKPHPNQIQIKSSPNPAAIKPKSKSNPARNQAGIKPQPKSSQGQQKSSRIQPKSEARSQPKSLKPEARSQGSRAKVRPIPGLPTLILCSSAENAAMTPAFLKRPGVMQCEPPTALLWPPRLGVLHRDMAQLTAGRKSSCSWHP